MSKIPIHTNFGIIMGLENPKVLSIIDQAIITIFKLLSMALHYYTKTTSKCFIFHFSMMTAIVLAA